MRPLDPLRSIKAKLGVVIVATVAATVGILALGAELGLAIELRVGELELDPAERRVRLAGAAVELTPTEFELLAVLAARPGTVHTREQLLAEVWGWRDGSGTRTVDSHVRGLRRKLGADWLRTVHGVGYALEAT